MGALASHLSPHLPRQMGGDYTLLAMAKKLECRLAPINRAYLRDLAKIGSYGRGEAGVMRRLVENGICDAIEKGVILKRSPDDFEPAKAEPEVEDADDDESDD